MSQLQSAQRQQHQIIIIKKNHYHHCRQQRQQRQQQKLPYFLSIPILQLLFLLLLLITGSTCAFSSFQTTKTKTTTSKSTLSQYILLFNKQNKQRSNNYKNNLGQSSSTQLNVLTTPEAIIEQASTQNLLDDLIDESVRTSARRPIMMQFDPSSGWIWRRWKGTVFSETWTSCVRNMIYAFCVFLVFRSRPNISSNLTGFNTLWGQLLSVTTFTLTFFVNQSYALWRKCTELSRRLQGRLHDIGLNCASHAARQPPQTRDEPSTYTPGARQVLELMSRYIRLFNLLTYASFTRSHRPILTPRGMRRLVERGLMTPQERQTLVDAEIPATQRHNAILMWMIRVYIEGRRAGHIGGGDGFEQQTMEKFHVIRAQYGAIGDELQGRMPLAYAHIVQVLVDLILFSYPIMALSSGMTPFLAILGTGLLTTSYQGLFDLAKQFLDPYDNENYGRGEDPLCVDTLIAETNAGSVRWMNAFNQMPFSADRVDRGELYPYLLPVRGYSVEELAKMEEERIQREKEMVEQRLREEAERIRRLEEEEAAAAAAESAAEAAAVAAELEELEQQERSNNATTTTITSVAGANRTMIDSNDNMTIISSATEEGILSSNSVVVNGDTNNITTPSTVTDDTGSNAESAATTIINGSSSNNNNNTTMAESIPKNTVSNATATVITSTVNIGKPTRPVHKVTTLATGVPISFNKTNVVVGQNKIVVEDESTNETKVINIDEILATNKNLPAPEVNATKLMSTNDAVDNSTDTIAIQDTTTVPEGVGPDNVVDVSYETLSNTPAATTTAAAVETTTMPGSDSSSTMPNDRISALEYLIQQEKQRRRLEPTRLLRKRRRQSRGPAVPTVGVSSYLDSISKKSDEVDSEGFDVYEEFILQQERERFEELRQYGMYDRYNPYGQQQPQQLYQWDNRDYSGWIPPPYPPPYPPPFQQQQQQQQPPPTTNIMGQQQQPPPIDSSPVLPSPITLEDYNNEISKIISAAEEELLETEAILRAPPGGDPVEDWDKKEETRTVANATETIPDEDPEYLSVLEMDVFDPDDDDEEEEEVNNEINNKEQATENDIQLDGGEMKQDDTLVDDSDVNNEVNNNGDKLESFDSSSEISSSFTMSNTTEINSAPNGSPSAQEDLSETTSSNDHENEIFIVHKIQEGYDNNVDSDDGGSSSEQSQAKPTDQIEPILLMTEEGSDNEIIDENDENDENDDNDNTVQHNESDDVEEIQAKPTDQIEPILLTNSEEEYEENDGDGGQKDEEANNKNNDKNNDEFQGTITNGNGANVESEVLIDSETTTNIYNDKNQLQKEEKEPQEEELQDEKSK